MNQACLGYKIRISAIGNWLGALFFQVIVGFTVECIIRASAL